MPAFRFILNVDQIAELDLALECARRKGDLQISNRILAVLAFGEGDYVDFDTIGKRYRVSGEAVRQWVSKYILGGLDALIKRKKPQGRPGNLTKTQRKELYRLVEEGPQKAGFPGACWRTPMIQELIRRRFKVFYSVKYISELLRNMGLSYQKARFATGGNDAENQQKREEWIKTTWPHIYALAKQKNAYILFGDEASFPQWGTLTYTWGPKGQQPTVPTSGKRKGYKVFGLIDYFSGKFFYKAQEGRLNSESYKDFLQYVLSKTRKHIILIQDGASYHVSKAMKVFFKEKENRLTVYQLPTYSPDYNPIEKVWKKIKTEETHLHYFPTFESLTKKVDSALLSFAFKGSEILSLFGLYTKIAHA